MRRMLLAVATAMALGICACAGAPPARSEPPPCATAHGFVMATDSASTLATDADVTEVRVVHDPERAQPALSIRLSDASAERVRQYTSAHVGDHVVLSVGNRVVARLTVRDPVESPVLVTGSSADDVAQMRASLCGG
jgi:preprotein translocase subunit SecD